MTKEGYAYEPVDLKDIQFEAYKKGVEDEIECMETSGEHVKVTKSQRKNMDEFYEIWKLIGKLKCGFPHGSTKWKKFTKIKKQLRKEMWSRYLSK